MAFTNLLGVVYPVGAVYCSTTATSPASMIGGTWTQIKGAVLAATGANGFADAASYGGNLAMTTDQMPVHSHKAQSKGSVGGDTQIGSWLMQWGASSLDHSTSFDMRETQTTGGGRTFCPSTSDSTSGIVWRSSVQGGGIDGLR